jgi:hypothetical protein
MIHLEVKQMSPPVLKAHSLTGRITPRLLLQAFKAVKRNRGKAGIDKISIQMFAANLEQNLLALMKDLKGRVVPTFPSSPGLRSEKRKRAASAWDSSRSGPGRSRSGSPPR